MPKFWTKKPDLVIFALQFENNFVIFEISTLKFVYFQIFTKNQKCKNLKPKMPDLCIFAKKCVIWVFLGKNYEKTILMFQISTLNFAYLPTFTKKQKCLNLGPTLSDLGIFVLEFQNNFLIFEINSLQFV